MTDNSWHFVKVVVEGIVLSGLILVGCALALYALDIYGPQPRPTTPLHVDLQPAPTETAFAGQPAGVLRYVFAAASQSESLS
jgi:hypothetical protein